MSRVTTELKSSFRFSSNIEATMVPFSAKWSSDSMRRARSQARVASITRRIKSSSRLLDCNHIWTDSTVCATDIHPPVACRVISCEMTRYASNSDCARKSCRSGIFMLSATKLRSS